MLNLLLEDAVKIAKRINSKAVVIISNESIEESIKEGIMILTAPKSYSIFFNTISSFEEGEYDTKKLLDKFIKVSRVDDYTSTMLYFRGVGLEEPVVGLIDSEQLKGIIIVDPKKSRIQRVVEDCMERISPNILRSVLNIALNIAHKGREGKKIGTGFIMGDTEEVLKRSRQLILNPYAGHPDKARNILEPANWESVMEFAQLDGLFIINEEGLIESAGRYLESPGKDIKLRQGLGGRHLACAAITRETEAVSIAVSESGDITIFKDGDELIVIHAHIF